MAQALVARHGGEVPASMDALVTLPGVGRKTANVVLGHALGVPGLPVDRHVLRVTNRIGLAQLRRPRRWSSGSSASALPRETWTLASDTFILHGRRVCKPKPLCDRCAVSGDVRRLSAAPRPTARGGPAGPLPPPTASAPTPRRRVADRSHDPGAVPPTRVRGDRHDPASFPPGTRRTSPSSSRTGLLPTLLEEMEIEPPDTLFGLYQGTPLTERRWDHGNVLPDRIAIYQEPIEDVSETEDDVVTEIGETLIHEVGHYFGLSEEEIEEIEDRYWHGRTGESDDDDDGADAGRRRRAGAMKARKRFGQHFLEPSWVDRVVDAIQPSATDSFLEIGPGHGALTLALARRVGGSAGRRNRPGPGADARRPRALERPGRRGRLPSGVGRNAARGAAAIRVAGNLPYNISTPILFRLLALAEHGVADHRRHRDAPARGRRPAGRRPGIGRLGRALGLSAAARDGSAAARAAAGGVSPAAEDPLRRRATHLPRAGPAGRRRRDVRRDSSAPSSCTAARC